MIRYMTSGESHGECLTAIIDGIPSGLMIDRDFVSAELARRMGGYGRGARMKIESDKALILSGLRRSTTIGSPIAILIKNKDFSIDKLPAILNPRPGHADLAGAIKYDFSDIRSVLERASARETAARVGVGALCKTLLAEFDIRVTSHIVMIGSVRIRESDLDFGQIVSLAGKSPVRCAETATSRLMCEEIDKAASEGDTIGGMFEVVVSGAPIGLGSYSQWDRRIDGSIARAIMSIPAIKAVGFGAGFGLAGIRGSLVHDEIFYSKAKGFERKTNNAGGIEGGMTNGEEIRVHAAMKPIATLKNPLSSINIKTKRTFKATVERSDVCAVPAAGVVGESVVAIEIANAMVEKFGGDSLGEMKRNYDGYMSQVGRF